MPLASLCSDSLLCLSKSPLASSPARYCIFLALLPVPPDEGGKVDLHAAKNLEICPKRLILYPRWCPRTLSSRSKVSSKISDVPFHLRYVSLTFSFFLYLYMVVRGSASDSVPVVRVHSSRGHSCPFSHSEQEHAHR